LAATNPLISIVCLRRFLKGFPDHWNLTTHLPEDQIPERFFMHEPATWPALPPTVAKKTLEWGKIARPKAVHREHSSTNGA
jgi:hypothetical protein